MVAVVAVQGQGMLWLALTPRRQHQHTCMPRQGVMTSPVPRGLAQARAKAKAVIVAQHPRARRHPRAREQRSLDLSRERNAVALRADPEEVQTARTQPKPVPVLVPAPRMPLHPFPAVGMRRKLQASNSAPDLEPEQALLEVKGGTNGGASPRQGTAPGHHRSRRRARWVMGGPATRADPIPSI